MSKGSYVVVVERLTEHTFHIEDVNSPEEAEDVANAWMDDGEMGRTEVLGCYVVDSVEDKEQEAPE